METDRNNYNEYVSQHMPRSRAGRNMLRAFVTGGLICTLGQILSGLYLRAGLEEETAGAKFGGAGTLVPITGFANAVVAPALEYKTEGKITGTAAKMFVISGPVIVYGVTAGTVYGLILWIAARM